MASRRVPKNTACSDASGATELTSLTAVEAVDLLRQRKVSPVELVNAAIRRIDATDAAINAVPIRCFDRALNAARGMERDYSRHRSDPRWLCGLPVAVKDMTDVAGVRCTYGSALFADRVPQRSDVLVETLERRGAIVLAKSNTPEFASAGGLNTTNELFGATRNPWDTGLTSGGSSGGSAAAVASGQVWLATGTDLGDSLRQPASFCSVVGLRPTPGRVARSTSLPNDMLCVVGPMGRTVTDVALMLDAMVGESPRDPISLPAPHYRYARGRQSWRAPKRVAFSPNLGLCPVAAEVAVVCADAAVRFADGSAVVEYASPDFSNAREILKVLRPAWLAAHWGYLIETHDDRLSGSFKARLDTGVKLSARVIWEAEKKRAALAQSVVQFFDRYDLLICPTAPIPAFPIGTARIADIDGVPLAAESESDWMLLTYAVSLVGCPALSLPCGFASDGRPVGLQLIGAPRAEGKLIGMAALLETIINLPRKTPIDPVPM
ncbi:MAG: hypothetical protein A3F74_27450 [Betaproteobacteria bacterium RIFCSPLOWO2_12_FULL_62_58]|nr:MAG: hypothetical protein A3F74_27450 [Betaproteobacteria bacterium RIFCSPLOWO2_12_FULL_62_58]